MKEFQVFGLFESKLEDVRLRDKWGIQSYHHIAQKELEPVSNPFSVTNKKIPRDKETNINKHWRAIFFGIIYSNYMSIFLSPWQAFLLPIWNFTHHQKVFFFQVLVGNANASEIDYTFLVEYKFGCFSRINGESNLAIIQLCCSCLSLATFILAFLYLFRDENCSNYTSLVDYKFGYFLEVIDKSNLAIGQLFCYALSLVILTIAFF